MSGAAEFWPFGLFAAIVALALWLRERARARRRARGPGRPGPAVAPWHADPNDREGGPDGDCD